MAIALNVIEPGTIGTYTDLVTKVADWLDRDDLTAQIPDFIALLESELRDKLRTTFQETLDIWTVEAGSYPLPDDVLAIRRLYPEGCPQATLKEVAADALPRFARASGWTRVFAIEGRTIKFAPASSTPFNVEVNYWRRIPPLSASAPENWLLRRRADIYLWGTLHYAAAFIRDPEAMTACRQYLDAAIEQLQQASRKDAWSGPLSPVGATQVRGAPC
ncbi:phage adaptor protein [Sphingobium abikonense]|uniref:phage adaptor protein n=1 Tax=Sphingobium abikonense TaxID=86193 RepID=UPI003518473F